MDYYIKIVTIIVLLLSGINANAQDNQRRYFAGLSIGTQALDYRGTNVAFEFGRWLRNCEIGLGFAYYYNPRGFSPIREESLNGSWEHHETFGAFVFAGYDFLALARHCHKHHLIPRLGLGYAHIASNGFSITKNKTDLYAWQYQGLEVSLVLDYHFDINHRLALGAYVEYDIRMREQCLIGTQLRVKI